MGFKITADGECSHKIKRHVLLGRKAMANLDSVLKSRDITLLTKVYIVKAMVFSVVTYGFESWTMKKAEHLRVDAFKLWCQRRLLKVLWNARRSNQSVLKEINPEYSVKGLMLKLKLQYLRHLSRSAGSLEKTLMQKEKEAAYDEMVRQHYGLNEHEFDLTQGDSGGQRCLVFYSPWGCKELAQLNDRTVTMTTLRTQDYVPISKSWPLQCPFAVWGTIFTDAGD